MRYYNSGYSIYSHSTQSLMLGAYSKFIESQRKVFGFLLDLITDIEQSSQVPISL